MDLNKKVWQLIHEHCALGKDNSRDEKDAITLKKAKEIAGNVFDMLYAGLTARELLEIRGLKISEVEEKLK